MIKSLFGVPVSIEANFLDLKVGNFVFRLIATTSLLSNLKANFLNESEFKKNSQKNRFSEVEVFVSMVFNKDEGFVLYGFLTEEEKEVFEELITISGIGPKLAFRIVEFLGKEVKTILSESPEKIAQVPRIGARKSRTLIPIIEDKFGGKAKSTLETKEMKHKKEILIQALRNLGFTRREALSMLDGIDLNKPESDIIVEILRREEMEG